MTTRFVKGGVGKSGGEGKHLDDVGTNNEEKTGGKVYLDRHYQQLQNHFHNKRNFHLY
jgi:hypothetical protein